MFHPAEPNPDFNKLEEEILKFWEKNDIPAKAGIYDMDPRLRGGEKRPLFVFYDGPPFATGLPHYGHLLASTIKDLVPRYQTMRGRFVRRRWGWDCHGLPIEEIVERALGISGKKEIEKIGIKKFNETCRSMVLQFVDEWGKMVRRIARWVDFDNSYKTMDRDYMESVWWAFKQFYDKGLVYEGRKVLLYCPRCETPISNFEVAMDNSYKEVTEEAVIVKFQITNSKSQINSKLQIPKNTYLLAWTTTPWTLIGNVALAVGEEIDYVLAEKDGENYIVAKGFNGWKGRKVIKGKDLVGLQYEPLFDVPEIAANPKAYHVYAADFVNTEEGTGIVHTAVVYGEEDYELGLREGLPVAPLLDEKGIFNEKAPALVRGQYFKTAEKTAKDYLQSKKLLFSKEKHAHSYPHCWRCGTMLFYNAIPAWFIAISKIKNKILKSNKEEIDWYPAHLKFGRYAKSVEQAPDWNISRNRYWGNPMPVWRCGKCGKDTVVGSVKELDSRLRGNDKLEDLHRPYIDEIVLNCEHCGGEARRITEIFDSWFEAGSMPFAEYHYPFENKTVFESRFPAQFVAEYIAQTRAWFYVMHVVSYVLFGRAPFENVVTTGTIMAEDWSKLSKSRRNFPDPWKVIEKYGADTLRFYLMNSVVMQGESMNFSEKDLGVVNRKVVRILWNVYNYFVTYANARMPINGQATSSPPIYRLLDHWILARLQELINNVTQHLDFYDTVHATRELQTFIDDLSTWYLRRSRGRQDKAFFATLQHCLVELSKLLAPFMPFLSEEIYGNLRVSATPDADKSARYTDVAEAFRPPQSVHLASWPEAKELSPEQQSLLKQMSEIRKIAEEVHALRAKAGVKLRQPLNKLTLDSRLRGNDELLNILKDEVNVKEIVFGDKLELDTTVTSELKLAGTVRELERAIQALRKERGLKIGEMAEMQYSTSSTLLREAMQKIDKRKIYAAALRQVQGITGKEIQIDGEKCTINIRV